MTASIVRAACLLLVLFSTTCYSQAVVVPSDRVVNGVTIRASASTQSRAVGLLKPGQKATYGGEVSSWYRVEHPKFGEGFVSKGWTELVTQPDAASSGAAFDVYVVDVGTGLGIFVRGSDFSLVYDAGSNDDLAGNRFLDFLAKAAPTVQTIDHLVVSHAHRDHISMLPGLLQSKQVKNVWDSGVLYASCAYQELLEAIAAEGATYRTAVFDGGVHTIAFQRSCSNTGDSVTMSFGPRIETGSVPLGKGASMQILYVDATKRSDLNENSLVVMLTLGGTRILLPGDSGGGGRAHPRTSPKPASVEGALLACCVNDLPANVLVLGHHGSKTSSRKAFVSAVQARDYVVSAGPFKYSGVTLPDREVIDLVKGMPNARVWRTDENDVACETQANKIGTGNDGKAAGCNTVHIHIPGGAAKYEVSFF